MPLGELINRDRVERGAKGGAGGGIKYGHKLCHKIKNDNKYFKKDMHITYKGDFRIIEWRPFKSDVQLNTTKDWRGIKKETLTTTILAVVRVNPYP